MKQKNYFYCLIFVQFCLVIAGGWLYFSTPKDSAYRWVGLILAVIYIIKIIIEIVRFQHRQKQEISASERNTKI